MLVPQMETDLPIETVASQPVYATFMARLRALLIDAIIITVAIAVLLLLAAFTEDLPGTGRIVIVAIFALVLLYEPVLVSRSGATIGHRRSGLRVVSDRTNGPPSFLVAFARFVLKTALGLPAFVTMALTRRHQAFHDLLTRTTVQVNDTSAVFPFDYVAARPAAPGEASKPSRLRRVIVSVAFLLLAYIALIGVLAMAVSGSCLLNSACSPNDELVRRIADIVFLTVMLMIIVLGWQGRLPGARRRPPSQ